MEQDTLFDMERTPLLEIPVQRPHPPRRRPDPAGWGEVTAAVFERDGWVCQRCGRTCAKAKAAGAKRGHWATADHIVPRSKGGWDDLVNLQTLCHKCNEFKGEQIIDYRADVALRLALDDARAIRPIFPDQLRQGSGGITRGAEPLEVVIACRVTRTEAAALRAAYGGTGYAARAGVDRLLYAG
jgi:hypothetical protein